LAAIAYEMLTGRPAFVANTLAVAVFQVVNKEPRSMREIVPELPAAVEEVVRRGLAKKAGERFPSIGAFAEAMRAAAAGAPLADSRADEDELTRGRPRSRVVSHSLMMGAAAGATILVGILAWNGWRGRNAGSPDLPDGRPLVELEGPSVPAAHRAATPTSVPPGAGVPTARSPHEAQLPPDERGAPHDNGESAGRSPAEETDLSAAHDLKGAAPLAPSPAPRLRARRPLVPARSTATAAPSGPAGLPGALGSPPSPSLVPVPSEGTLIEKLD
jgi:serine/threonine-protein kinase